MNVRATRAEIDLDAIANNIAVIRSRLKPETKYIAVVKADAYGHGCAEVAARALKEGAAMLAIAIPEEGCALREAGFTAPILILGPSDPSCYEDIVRFDLMPALFTADSILRFEAAAAAQNRTASFHFKVDTGMGRIGCRTEEDFLSAMEALKDCPHLTFAGMFTHFAVSEIPDKTYTRRQAELFLKFAGLAQESGYRPLLHCCNSAAALDLPEYQLDAVRGGIAMYGCHPAGRAGESAGLRPALRWRTEIAYLKEIPAGETVSYGRRFTAQRPTLVATLPVGYGDGLRRGLSGKVSFLVRGQRVPQIGAICMDQCMCDVTDVPGVCAGDEVVLIGTQGDACVSADEMAELAGTISYEILLGISKRVPRVYSGTGELR